MSQLKTKNELNEMWQAYNVYMSAVGGARWVRISLGRFYISHEESRMTKQPGITSTNILKLQR